MRIQTITRRRRAAGYAHGPEEDAGMDLRAVERRGARAGHAAAWCRPDWRSSCRRLRGADPPAQRPGAEARHHHAQRPATIDPGYRGEIRVILLNLGREPYEIHPGDRIAQMVSRGMRPSSGRRASWTSRGAGRAGSARRDGSGADDRCASSAFGRDGQGRKTSPVAGGRWLVAGGQVRVAGQFGFVGQFCPQPAFSWPSRCACRVFHEISRAAGPPKRTTDNDGLSHAPNHF